MDGRLYEIRDFNSNVVQILWDRTWLRDAGGRHGGAAYAFNYKRPTVAHERLVQALVGQLHLRLIEPACIEILLWSGGLLKRQHPLQFGYDHPTTAQQHPRSRGTPMFW